MQESVVFGCFDNSPGSDRTDRRLHNSRRLALRDVFCEHILWEDCVSSGNRLMGWTSLAYFVRGTFQPFPSNSAGGRPRAGAPFCGKKRCKIVAYIHRARFYLVYETCGFLQAVL
jgi:hypothetical protein